MLPDLSLYEWATGTLGTAIIVGDIRVPDGPVHPTLLLQQAIRHVYAAGARAAVSRGGHRWRI